jgi:hypothetical protein
MTEHAIAMETITGRMEELGLGFMAAGLVTFLGSSGRADVTLFDSIRELVDIEYVARSERTARTRLKLSGMPQSKRLDEFDLSWLKGGMMSPFVNTDSEQKISGFIRSCYAAASSLCSTNLPA